MNPAHMQFHVGGNPLPSTAWKQWITNVLRTMTIEQTDDYESYIERTNANGMNWVIRVGLGRITNATEAADYSFRVIPISLTQVQITLGLVVLGNDDIAITDWPDDGIVTCSDALTFAWLRVDGEDDTVSFETGTYLPALSGEEVRKQILYRIFDGTWVDSTGTDPVLPAHIANICGRLCGDLHVPRMA